MRRNCKSDMMRPSVSIVIPLYNGAALIPACLNAVLPQTRAHGAAEVIVIDNASTDNCDQALAPFADAIRVQRLSFNTGFATAANTGIQLSQREIVVLLNQDAIVQGGWLSALLARFEASPAAAIVGSKCVRADGTIDHAGGVIRLPLFYTAHVGMGEPDGPAHNQPAQCDYVTGAALAVRRAAIERIGMLDRGFYPAYYEETDLCLRAREAGYEVWYEPAAVVLHHSGQTPLEQMSVERIATFHRNRLRCLIKHTSPEQIGAVLREAEMDEIESPQAMGLLTGRSIAYRDVLRGILAGDPVLSTRMTPDAVEALAQCYRRAYRRAAQTFDDPMLPISRRIEMTQRPETWQELRRGLERIVEELERAHHELQFLSLANHAPAGSDSLPQTSAGAPVAERNPQETIPQDNVEAPAQATGPQDNTETTATMPSEAAQEHPQPTHHAREENTHAAESSPSPAGLIEAYLALHRRLSDLDQRLAQLGLLAQLPPQPAPPRSLREWLRVCWEYARSLLSGPYVIRHPFRWQAENVARVTHVAGEARSLVGLAADNLLLNAQLAGQLAQTRQHTQQLADLLAQTYQRTGALGSALKTTCQFLHECITWQADVTRRVHELGRHTSALAESEAASAIIQALQATDIHPTSSDSSV